ncbi:MAG: hypothetical protein CL678_08420 [Bdellovibrionaceae bacterium]|nr:hypothetical protein [Pseudobdellovibrionaceae bacterium]
MILYKTSDTPGDSREPTLGIKPTIGGGTKKMRIRRGHFHTYDLKKIQGSEVWKPPLFQKEREREEMPLTEYGTFQWRIPLW